MNKKLLAGIYYLAVLSFLSFYAIEVDFVKKASFFFLLYAIVELLSRPLSGRLLDGKGEKSLACSYLANLTRIQNHTGI
ncbi:hypothetical protein [Sporosarcina oncorhynchi]|uniref:hypothetical protein n=1 Tax=Sporosarcina oncorhynchi TaxID=3056444 RepID=UPI00295E4E68|nr:hypothetical protein [Sporosarcina sp. T2O-4]